MKKFKENFKRFWSLQKHSTGGFTLVELIVVIAILAILAGIAVPAYSGYVEKTDKAADETLAGEIEQALLLAHYGQQLDEPTTVVVYYDEAIQAEATTAAGEAAMEATFGSGWKDLHLSYSGWNEESGGMSLNELYNNIKGSSFDPEGDTLEYLLVDVQNVVGVLAGAVGSGGININANTGIGKYLTEQGIALDAENKYAIANGAVMYVADTMKNQLNSAENRNQFATTWAQPNGSALHEIPDFDLGNEYANLATKYAYVEAIASYVDEKTAGEGAGATNFVEILRGETNDGNITNKTQMLSTLDYVMDRIGGQSSEYGEYVMEYFGVSISPEGGPVFADSCDTAAYKNAQAFTAYMQGLSANSNFLIEQGNMNRDDYYTDGKIQNLVTNYVIQGESLVTADMSKGAFAFYFNNENVNVICLPLDMIGD